VSPAVALQASGQPAPEFVGGLAEALGLVASGGAVAAAAAALYRWYTDERMALALPTLLSLGVVAVALNTTGALQAVIGDRQGLLDPWVVLVNGATFAAAALIVPAAVRVGDRFAVSARAVGGARTLNGEVSTLVRSVGRVIVVELPAEIDDVEGYDPVPRETKSEMAGRTLVFPRNLTVAELKERLATRLREDFGVGHVDVDLTAEGTVEHLGVGSRAAGLGPTLPPGTVAVAIHADPAFAASPGDRVQVYRPGTPPERVATGELRAAVGDVATLAVDAGDAAALDDATRYRLATLPGEVRPEDAFAGLLRDADETMGVATVSEGAPLSGAVVGSIAPVVVAVRPTDGPIEPLPPRDRLLAPGDTVYAVGRPATLRRLEDGAARPVDAD
jgi:hypothetical protein